MIRFVVRLMLHVGIVHASLQDNYPDPDVFDGFRYSRMRETKGESAKHVVTTPTLNYLAFGHGRPAWYGYFFFWCRRTTESLSQPWEVLCGVRNQDAACVRAVEL